MSKPSDLVQGTLDVLLLKLLALEPLHGWGISKRIRQLSKDVLQINQGSLYPALRRLEVKGWLSGDWRASESNRRARYYSLTAAGRRALGSEAESWRKYVEAVGWILAGETS